MRNCCCAEGVKVDAIYVAVVTDEAFNVLLLPLKFCLLSKAVRLDLTYYIGEHQMPYLYCRVVEMFYLHQDHMQMFNTECERMMTVRSFRRVFFKL